MSRAKLTVSIRPAPSVYATYRRLSYRPWYAIAEFVDNSTQSYYDHRPELLEAYGGEGNPGRLRVEVSYDSERNSLTIYDNANGMDIEELTRAIVLDRPPPNTSGRCEYGMGLKTAACWFGATWTIRTSRLGSDRLLVARVHVPDLVERQIDEVEIEELETEPSSHFTLVALEGLYQPIRGRTTARIRDQLGSMYREDLRSGEIEILWNGEPVRFEEPPILEEDLGGGVSVAWRKEITLEVPWEGAGGGMLTAYGWVGIRSPGSQRDAGFALLRRGRVVIGGPGEGYKPMEIFGQGNTFRSQRLLGELHMDAWPVTQAKDTFDWSSGLEDVFIETLKRACQDYMDKAEGYREHTRPVSVADMELASEPTRGVFRDSRFGRAVEEEIRLPDPPKTDEQQRADTAKLRSLSSGPVQYRLDLGRGVWLFRLHWQDQLSDAHWMQVSYPGDNLIDIFLNMAHPFFAPYLDRPGFLEVLQKFVLALALAERMAREISSDGLVAPSDFRNYMNRILRRASEIEVNRDS